MPELALGLDAAWTPRGSSGVALLSVPGSGKPTLLRVGPSYSEFCNSGPIQWAASAPGTPPDLTALIAHIQARWHAQPRVIALDIPIGPRPIAGRRAADNAIARAYGSRKAPTHTPTKDRPGTVSEQLYRQLVDMGYVWATNASPSRGTPTSRSFFETYPHAAIIELMNLKERLPYKVDRRWSYKLSLEPIAFNLDRLRSALGSLLRVDNAAVPGASTLLSSNGKASSRPLKRLEDALDSIICAYSAWRFMLGAAMPYGDAASAIWVPLPP